MMLKISQIN